jgi:hypothetical protein
MDVKAPVDGHLVIPEINQGVVFDIMETLLPGLGNMSTSTALTPAKIRLAFTITLPTKSGFA